MRTTSLLLASLLLCAAASPTPAQTRFKVDQDAKGWWLVDPAGTRFVSLGVCCLDTGVPFVSYDLLNPSYAAYRFNPDRTVWATSVSQRLQDWHFNTVGAWSDDTSLALGAKNNLYRTPILNLGAAAGAPWKDLWSPAVNAIMAEAADRQIRITPKDKKTIGYFSDNELGWWEGALFDWIWKSGPNGGPRTHFVEVLKNRYGSWSALQKDFTPLLATGFADLLGHGRLYLKPGGSGMKTIQSYTGVLADRYYSVCRQLIKKSDPGALYLGDRYISNFYPEIAQASSKYVDVVSTNLNGDWNDGTFANFYLKNLEQVTQKPILISEYYQAATQNRSGNKNDSSGFPVVPTQADRAGRVEVSTKHLLAQPFVVGAHWFQYYDEPTKGRGDGENYNMGLVDINDKPYEEVTKVFGSLDLTALHASGQPSPMDATSGIPPAPGDPSKLEAWNRTRGYIPPTTDSMRADLYASYSADSINLAIYWNEDRFSEAFYQGGKVPPADYPQIHVRVGKSYVTVAVPPSGVIAVSGNGRLISETRGVRNSVILRIPTTTSLGQSVAIDVGLATRGRAYFGRWKGNFTLGQGS